MRIGKARVTFDGASWRGNDAGLVRLLEVLTPYDQNSPSIPRFDVFAAKHVAGKLGDAQIVEVSPDSDEDDAGVVY